MDPTLEPMTLAWGDSAPRPRVRLPELPETMRAREWLSMWLVDDVAARYVTGHKYGRLPTEGRVVGYWREHDDRLAAYLEPGFPGADHRVLIAGDLEEEVVSAWRGIRPSLVAIYGGGQ